MNRIHVSGGGCCLTITAPMRILRGLTKANRRQRLAELAGDLREVREQRVAVRIRIEDPDQMKIEPSIEQAALRRVRSGSPMSGAGGS